MNAPKYPSLLDPELARKFYALDDDSKEFFTERAGIRQFSGQQSRTEAEAGAWEDTLRYLEQRNAAPDRP
jgi:hypothetical protein